MDEFRSPSTRTAVSSSVDTTGISNQSKSARRLTRETVPRSKRAKYTAAACDECKRRKLKCIQESGAHSCNRCNAGDIACSLQGDDSAPAPSTAPLQPDDDSTRIDRLERELAALRRQVAHLVSIVDKGQTPRSEAQVTENACTPSYASLAAAGVKERKEVQFVGTTRPAFALNVAKATLSVVDEPSDDSSSDAEGLQAPPVHSPEVFHSSAQDPLLGMPLSAVYRLLDTFRDEIEPIYPLLDTVNLRSRAAEMIQQFRDEFSLKFDGRLSQKDIHLLKIVLAAALVLDNQGKTELSAQLISSFEDDALRITSPSDVDLQEAQIFAIMSIYHFHCDEELLAYRSIGISTRMVLELGLHRRRSLYENYPDPVHRSLASRVFWCIYVLDRRWSFGTGLSFALIDRDLDPRLPEPPSELPYFRCLVAYAKLCSKVWDAIPHYGSSSETMLPYTESLLESEIQGWFSTIPEDLQVTTAESSPAVGTLHHDRRLFQHMQTLLYLRGNYIRCLIHRHHVSSPADIAKQPGNAQLVVSIAQDTIRILVSLNGTSDIYKRHQIAYNYFLISAISILLLAVCHAPAEFAQICRQNFFAAIDLVRGFSRLSLQGRRLWSSLRGLVARLRQLGIMNAEPTQGRTRRARKPQIGGLENAQASNHAPDPVSTITLELSPRGFDAPAQSNHEWQAVVPANFDTTTPDMNLMGDDLVGVFDTFGRAYMDSNNPRVQSAGAQFDDNLAFLNGDNDDFSEYFLGLI